MLIAILSDSHDNMKNITKAIRIAKERGITEAFHLGDVCAPPAFTLMAESGLHWRTVWGNVDGDRLLSYRRVAESGMVDMSDGEFRELEIEGRKIFLTHYPEIARIAALSGKYDAAFHGHNHQASMETVANQNGPIKECLLVNPGEVAGFRYGKPSFGIYNTEDNTFEPVEL